MNDIDGIGQTRACSCITAWSLLDDLRAELARYQACNGLESFEKFMLQNP